MKENTRYGSIFNIQKFSINDGPGIRTTVFLAGCPLRCRWCSNPESQNRFLERLSPGFSPAPAEWTVDGVVEAVRRDLAFYEESGGGVTLSGGEPLWQPEFSRALLLALREEGIHTALETTGFASPGDFEAVASCADLLLFDLKHRDSGMHREHTGVPNTRILENLRTALRQGVPTIARIPVIPGFNDSPGCAREFADLLLDLKLIEAHLLPFHRLGEQKYKRLGVPYPMAGAAQLSPGDLEEYRQILTRRGVRCSIR